MAKRTDAAHYWQSVYNGVVKAHGPKETIPDATTRKQQKDAHYKLYIEGKLKK